MERLLPLATGAVVPGHGAVGDRAFVEEQLAAFRGLAELARRVHAGELDIAGGRRRRRRSAAETARTPLERALAQLRGELD